MAIRTYTFNKIPKICLMRLEGLKNSKEGKCLGYMLVDELFSSTLWHTSSNFENWGTACGTRNEGLIIICAT